MYPKGHQTTTLRALKPILAAIKITADTASYTLKAFIDTTVVTPSVPMIPDTSLSISPKRLKVYNEKNVFKPNTTTNVPLSSVLSYIPEKMASIRGFNVTSRNINTSKMAFMNSHNYIITTTRDIRVKNVTERVIADTAISTLKTVSNKFNGKKLFFGKTVSELDIFSHQTFSSTLGLMNEKASTYVSNKAYSKTNIKIQKSTSLAVLNATNNKDLQRATQSIIQLTDKVSFNF